MENLYAQMLEQARLHVAEGRLGKDDAYGTFPTDPIAVHLLYIKPELTPNEIYCGAYRRLKYSVVADYYGYPAWIAALHDAVFYGLPLTESLDWHIQIAETIVAYGERADWRKAFHRSHIGLLSMALEAIPSTYVDRAAQRDAVRRVATLHEIALEGGTLSRTEWNEAAEVASAQSHFITYPVNGLNHAGREAARAAHCSAQWFSDEKDGLAHLEPVRTLDAADCAACASAYVVRHGVEWSHKLPLLQAEWHPGESVLPFVENVIAFEKARLEEYDAAKSAYEAALVINYQKIRDLTLSAIRDAASG